MALYQANPATALELLATCGRALEDLSRGITPQPLPVFAARLTGDPHALDQDRPLGRLFLAAILWLAGVGTELRAEERRALLSRIGLQEDDLSSNVLVGGLQVHAADPRVGLFAAAAATASPLILPLRFLTRPIAWQNQAVYVVENPAVFSILLQAWPHASSQIALVCTSGRPTVAALTLLDQLVSTGNHLFYGGDFDGEGLDIGLDLQRRYRESFIPWLFDTRAYQMATRGVPLTAKQRHQIARLEIPWDAGLVPAILERGLVVYQESLVDTMLANPEIKG